MGKLNIRWLVAAYAGGSLTWIVATDLLIGRYLPSVPAHLLTVKDASFLFLASGLLLGLLTRQARQRERQDRALRESESRYRSLFMGSLDALVLASDDGRCFCANPAAEALFGLTEAEIVQAGRAGLFDPDDPRLPRLWQSRAATGQARGEVRFRRKTGELFEAEVSVSACEDFHGQPCFCLALRDISARKHTEEALQKEIQRRRALMEVSNDGIAIFSQDHRILEANRRFAAMLGYPPEAMTSLSSWDFEAALTEDQIRSAFRDFTHINQTFETRHRRRDGTVYDAEVSASGARIGDERLIITICRDITDRKRTEERLRQSEERFRSLFDNVETVAVQGYDRDRNVLYWNPASEALYGYSREEALGQKLETLIIPPAMRPYVVEDIRRWIEEGRPIPAGELRLSRQDGSEVPVFSSHVLQQTGSGDCELFCLDIDLTETEAMRKELIASKDAAVAANRAKTEFLANMSHEIRTPLNGIYGMLQLLATTSPDDEQQEYVTAALKSAKRLSSLLSDILDLSKIEANKLDICRKAFPFQELVQSLKDIFVLSAREKALRIKFSVEDGIPGHLVGDEIRVRQILFNLIGNAIKFTETGGVAVKACLLPESADGRVRILFSVKDTGIGIREDKVHYVFEPFAQADGSYIREQQGAGLGLTIVKRVVEMLDGILCIDSKFGSGTTISVALPFDHCREPAGPEAAAPAGLDRTGKRRRILLVEDEETNRDVARRMLEKFGWDVTVAADGQAAVEQVFANHFDCILMDIQMPVMDGVAATRLIRTAVPLGEKRAIPIIAMTAYAMSGDREKFLACGMDEYISKPFEHTDLRAVVEKALARRPRLG
ncbi:PAS/PAC sensor hybrid histidine kinase [Solidesulfovibrio carbinoliphilus subsp. oakridgensis]|uniref:Sensory/regulatory protein RpfC n=1 Tax=Solidesulfovibrio carbinoliphilus subsp. oakridgensis TaxID=694327 RepID=G7Q6Q4_9BACT|nr:PAS domain S-box protein [Solidesulfovibrio carbinoliphilus]EHJ47989.1 PAS/PAC sensor hybrid histidine kinase [Solidesulfovibrio carbinoliphilus subsp. oakridgensis]